MKTNRSCLWTHTFSHLDSTALGICNKLEKINPNTTTATGICGRPKFRQCCQPLDKLQMLRSEALLRGSQNYGTKIELDEQCGDELMWWIHDLIDWNGKFIVHPCPNLVITSDSSKIGWVQFATR